MRPSFTTAAEGYLRAKSLSRGSRNVSQSTLRKWSQWGHGVPIQKLPRRRAGDLLDWVYEWAVADRGRTPVGRRTRPESTCGPSCPGRGRRWSPPRFPQPRPQRDMAGRHYLTKAESSPPFTTPPTGYGGGRAGTNRYRSADEPGGPRPHPERHAGRPAAGRTRVLRRCAAECPVPVLRLFNFRRVLRQNECGNLIPCGLGRCLQGCRTRQPR